MPNAVPGGAGERPRATAAVAAGVAALAAAATLPGAIDLPFWQDEVASARVLLEPTPTRVIDHVARTESTPPGWYLLTWLGREAGIPLESLRYLSVALAAALAGLTVVYARRFLPLWTAALAGALTALAWQTVAHGSELRAYSLLALLTLGFALLLERAAAEPRLGRLVALAACTAAGAYTHYFFLLAAVAGLVWLAVERELRAVALRTGSAIVLGAATLLAWLPGLVDQVGAERFGWIDAFDPVKFASLPSALFWDPGTMYAELGADPGFWEAAARVAILALVLGGCAVLRRLGSSARLCALLVVVPVGVSGIAWLAGLRIITGRNLIGVTAFAAVALAAVLLPLPRRTAFGAAALGLALAVFSYVRAPMPERPDFDQVADALVDAGWAPGDPILVVGSLPDFRSPLEWYLPGGVTLPEAAPREACTDVWVVTDVPRGRDLLDLASPASREDVGAVEVARVPWNGGLVGEAEARGGRYLDSAAGAGCLRPLEDRTI
jgi:Dolichyl-phosphate-mannose-protein mannosyltransferase